MNTLEHTYQVIQSLFHSAELARFVLDWLVSGLIISVVSLVCLKFLSKENARLRRSVALLSLSLLLIYPFLLLWFDHFHWVYVEWGLPIGQWGERPTFPAYAYPFLVSLYMLIIGVAIALLVRLVIQIFRMSRLVKKLKVSHFNNEAERLRDHPLASEFNKILIVSNLVSPCVSGIQQTILLVPEDFYEKASDEDLRRMLAHESSHIRNNDLLLMLISQASIYLFWWNPIVHLLRAQLSLAVEQIADEEAASLTDSKLQYAKWLVSYLDHCCQPQINISAANLFKSKSELVERTRYILHPPKLTGRIKCYAIVGVIVSSVVFSLLFRANQQKLDHFKIPSHEIK